MTKNRIPQHNNIFLKWRVLFCFGISLFIFLFPFDLAHADFDTEYQGYLKTYDNYRNHLTSYITTRNQYLTYGTLTAKNEALTAVRDFLIARSDVLLSYISLLRYKYTNDALYLPLLDAEQNFLVAHKTKIPAVGSLDDAVDISQEVEKRHLPFQITSRKIVGTILLLKVESYKDELTALENEADVLIQTLKSEGKDVAVAERWLLESKNKKTLAEQKLVQVRTQIDKLRSSRLEDLVLNYNNIQFSTSDANLYLKEAAGYLFELKESIKYGNY